MTDPSLESLVAKELEALQSSGNPEQAITSQHVIHLVDTLLAFDGAPFAFDSAREKVEYFARHWIEHVRKPEVLSHYAISVALAYAMLSQYGGALSKNEYATLAASLAFIAADFFNTLPAKSNEG